MASSSSSFTHTGINPRGGQVFLAQALLDQAQVFGGPEQFRGKAAQAEGRPGPPLPLHYE